MKQLTAIFLFILFLFNLAGYRLLFHYLGERSETRYETLIDGRQYNESSLLTIKIDMNIPYQAEHTDFERVSGEITVDGVVYQYVKRRIYNGQLVLLCIPNEDKTKLQDAKKKYVEWWNDISTKKNPKQGSSKQSVQSSNFNEYECQTFDSLETTAFELETNKFIVDEVLPHSYWADSPVKPPDASTLI